ncbi:tyrosine-type recombinase/integrase [Petroclostridium sp. X23]|uniref:tyrosine-type recombinase/integrase n=1 Tax=Petroclostridium sp. X23 TaxID=3045146 RepID=UPI0024AC935A|nr:tyrosine-type recombinase/integrase [Petroclostridium sp. X23]WHH60063.1 tyrosine-type recombinase/integrase [Petroclostridium sp. X23]
MSEFYTTGKLQWRCSPRGSKFKLNEYFQELQEQFLSSTSYHVNTKGDVTWAVRKYLAFLESQGHHDLVNISIKDIQAFLIYCSRHLKGGSLLNVRGYIKNFHIYLQKTGLYSLDCEKIFSQPIVRETKIFPYITYDELNKVLNQIDRSLKIGKRNFAIITLAMHTGLRAVDIVNLKLRDIDWKTGEIHIVQQKTQKVLSLPLTHAVGEAIKDYIIHGRPNSGSEYVFLRTNAPYQNLSNGVSIANIFNDYQKKAGIARKPFDGKGFHSIRRAIGRNMAVAEIPITTIAQVLGHGDIESAKQYISLDSIHLKECALDFNGIEVGDGVLPK